MDQQAAMYEEMSNASYEADLGDFSQNIDNSLAPGVSNFVADGQYDSVTAYIEKKNGLPFCTVCGYSSKYLSHIKTHLEVKHLNHAYPCKLCTKICPARDYLNRHMKNKHKDWFKKPAHLQNTPYLAA